MHSRSKSNPNLTYRPKSAREGQSPSKTPNRVRPEEKSPNQKWKFFKEIQAKFDRPVSAPKRQNEGKNDLGKKIEQSKTQNRNDILNFKVKFEKGRIDENGRSYNVISNPGPESPMRLGKKPGVINPPQSVYEKTRRQLKSPPVSARISSRDPITEGETPKIYKQRNPQPSLRLHTENSRKVLLPSQREELTSRSPSYSRTAMNTEMPKLVKQRTIVQNQGEIMRAILAHKFMVIE